MKEKLIFTILKRTVIISLLIIGFSFFLFKNPKPILLGYIFGTIISILGFKLLDITISKAIVMSPSKANSYSTIHYIIRYLIYFVVLTVSAIANYLNFPAAILGLLSVKFVILCSTIFDKNFMK